MPLRNGKPLIFVPRGVTDSIDATSSFPGSMVALTNLIPAQSTRGVMVPRPAATLLTAFGSFTTPSQGEAIFVQGTRVFGLIASGRNVGHSEPFCFDTATSSFVTISGITAANTPTSIATTGAWTPPTMAQIGSRIIVTHPGFDGVTHFFGWFDTSGFSDTTRTGNTHTSTLVDTLSTNVITAGWRPGMTISDSAGDIPAGTTILSIAANGLSLTLSAAATGTNPGTTFTVTGGTIAAPLWAAGDLTGAGTTGTAAIGAIPVAVAQFSGRAYYATKNAVVYSDSGDALLRNNASVIQVLTFQNGLNVTALAGLPLDNQLGGVIQSLMVFQGANTIQQILGDQATSNLTVNQITESVGTLAPLTIAGVPNGSSSALLFVAPDGLRMLDVNGNVSEPIGANGDGIALPFQNALQPSRMSASYNEDVYRVAVTGNIAVGGQILNNSQSVEYWYHIKLRAWSGPHSGGVLPARIMAASQIDTSTILFSLVAGSIGLWSSTTLPTFNSTYTENAIALSWLYQTSLVPDNQTMSMNSMVETTVALAIGVNDTISIIFQDEGGLVLDMEQLSPSLGGGPLSSLWGNVFWGQFLWGATTGQGSTPFRQIQIPWAVPLTFKQGFYSMSGPSNYSVRLGNVYMRYQELGYVLQGNLVA